MTIEVNGVNVDVTHKSVGPKHDPYDRTTVTLVRGAHRAEYVECALAGTTLTLYRDWQPGCRVEVRKVKARELWQGATLEQARCDDTKLRLLCKRWVGCGPAEARDAWESGYEPDPMGHPSQYE